MKKNYLKSLCAATLATVLILSNSLCALAETPTVSGGDTPAVASVSDNGTVSGNTTPTTPSTPTTPGTPTEAKKLPAPTNLQWGENYQLTFTGVELAEGKYDVELYKDGELCHATTWNMGTLWGLEHNINYSVEIEESGVYKVRIRSSANYYEDGTTTPEYTDSDWAESPEATYVRPDEVLGTTNAYWDEGRPGYFFYNSVKNAGGYRVEIYFTPEGETEEGHLGAHWSVRAGRADEAGVTMVDDITDRIEKNGAGKYRIKIQALSGDIDTYANGVAGEFSAYYDTTQTASMVGSTIANAMANKTPSEALDTIKDELDIDSMKMAMQTDDTVLGQMKELEEKYVAEKGIAVKKPAVSSDASKYVDSSKINMVGAGLNVDAGAVQLDVTVPAKKEYVNTSHYKNAVQLAIELKHDNTSVHQLQVPITITMPVPEGLDAGRLAVLHYHADGTFEVVNLKNNGDGTVTFTVTEFSTFVFAEKTSGGSIDWEDEDVQTEDYDDDDEDDGVITSSDMTVLVDWDAESKKVDAAVASKKAQNVDILTGKDVQAPLALMNKIAGKNVTLALHTGNGIAISVSGANNRTVKNPVNLLVTGADGVPGYVKNTVLANTVSSRTIHIEEKEKLTAKVNLHVNVGAENVGKRANLYYYDEVSKSMKLVGTYVINKDGQAMFCLSRSGDFVVTVTNGAPTAVAGGYTVIAGDTLSGIAARHGISLKNLVAANPQISDANKIYPGQIINLK